MATNPYVNWISDPAEQSLVRSLSTEFIKFHSMAVVYLPRHMRREDSLYSEDILSNFTSSFKIPVYLKDVTGWTGKGDFMNKFGIHVHDHMNMVVARDRFAEILAPAGLTRPMEGDLIYLPLPLNALFEIHFVEHEKAKAQFYPLGGLYFYEMRCILHTYNQEDWNTGTPSLDAFETEVAYSQKLEFTSGTGNFMVGETVFAGGSMSSALATGVVGTWSNTTNTLSLTYITGEFPNTGSVTGATSGAVYSLSAAPDRITMPNDSDNENDYLRDESLSIIDTSGL